MRQHVPGQHVSVCKRFRTQFTFVWSFAGVRTFVLDSGTEIGKVSIAKFARVRLLAGMRTHVSGQFDFDHKSFFADSVCVCVCERGKVRMTSLICHKH